MQISIEPRKESDGSGILMMPLRKNVPLPRDPDWKLTICPECGRKCWDRPLTEGYRVRKKLCTECALQESMEHCESYEPIEQEQKEGGSNEQINL